MPIKGRLLTAGYQPRELDKSDEVTVGEQRHPDEFSKRTPSFSIGKSEVVHPRSFFSDPIESVNRLADMLGNF